MITAGAAFRDPVSAEGEGTAHERAAPGGEVVRGYTIEVPTQATSLALVPSREGDKDTIDQVIVHRQTEVCFQHCISSALKDDDSSTVEIHGQSPNYTIDLTKK